MGPERTHRELVMGRGQGEVGEKRGAMEHARNEAHAREEDVDDVVHGLRLRKIVGPARECVSLTFLGKLLWTYSEYTTCDTCGLSCRGDVSGTWNAAPETDPVYCCCG